jgi:hypothetical protein
MNKLYLLVLLLGFSACKKTLVEPLDLSWQTGKIRTIEVSDDKGELSMSTFKYELLLPDSTVLVKERLNQIASKKISEKLVYTRDALRRPLTAVRTYKEGDSSLINSRVFKYNKTGLLEYYGDTLPKQMSGHLYEYNISGQLKRIYQYSQKTTGFKVSNTYDYTWSGTSITSKIDRNNGVYEQTDFQYDKTENPLYAFNKTYLKEIGTETIYFSPLKIAAFQEVFKNAVYKYTYEYDTKGRVVNIILNKLSGNSYLISSKIKITYY